MAKVGHVDRVAELAERWWQHNSDEYWQTINLLNEERYVFDDLYESVETLICIYKKTYEWYQEKED